MGWWGEVKPISPRSCGMSPDSWNDLQNMRKIGEHKRREEKRIDGHSNKRR